MNNERLSVAERDLLQRYHDEELSEFEAKRAAKLIESRDDARDFVEGLQEVGEATRVAEEEAWQQVDPPAAAAIVEFAANAADPAIAAIEDLAPLLERFFDGETTDEESEFVAELIDAREDVAGYIMGLEGLRAGVRVSEELAAEVDFGGFWDAVASRIDDGSAESFGDEDRVLLYRFNDGEASDSEVAQVNSWVDDEQSQALGTLDALRELKLATTAAIEEAQEGVDFGSIWAAVEDAMDEDLESQGENVVALGKARREKEEQKSFFLQYQQAIVGAVAAIFVVAFVGGIFNEQIFGTQKVIVEKTVVIVDSVEYAPGSSVMINSPVQEASAIQNPDSEEEPTVIWLLDSGEENLEDGDAPAIEAAPADAEADAEYRAKQPI